MNENDPTKLMTATIGERLDASNEQLDTTNLPQPTTPPGRFDAHAGRWTAAFLRPIAAFLHRRHVMRPADALVVAADHVEASGLRGACTAALHELQARTTRVVSRA